MVSAPASRRPGRTPALRHTPRLPLLARHTLALALALAGLAWASPAAWSAEPAAASSPGAETPPANSKLDAPLLYQLLIGEMELSSGQPGTAGAGDCRADPDPRPHRL